MKKQFLAMLLALVMCLGLAAPAFAADEEFTIDENGVLTRYNGPGGDVAIPEGVTAIGTGAFSGSPGSFGLTSVTIPEGVTEIGPRAFSGCFGLTAVNLPESAAKIEESAFWGCEALASIDLPSSLTEISDSLFWGCAGLTGITIPDGVTEIGSNAFSFCSSLATVDIPESVAAIGIDVFKETPWLERQGEFVVVNGLLLDYQGEGGDVAIPNGVTEICMYAFACREDLISVAIPEGVTSIGAFAFFDCTGLASVTLPESLVSIGSDAFQDCAALTAVDIPSGVTEISPSAFVDCAGLTSVVIPSGVTEISSAAFGGCTGLTSVTLPDALTKIDSYAFADCAGLPSLSIPGSVTSIGDYAFRDCDSLTSVALPDSITEIGAGAFEDCNGLTSVTLPDSVAKIGGDAFSHTPWLERQGEFPVFNGILLSYLGKDSAVVIPDGITAIGDRAFMLSDMTYVTIPDSVTSIGGLAFYHCPYLNNVTIPGSVTEIGDSAFGECHSIANVTVPASVTKIGEHAFACFEGGGHSGWFYYYIPDGLTIYGEAGSYAETYAKENEIPFTTEKPLAFADLRPNAYYLDAVDWAVSRGVTTGTTPTTFSPDQTCTHAQILTFLWRAAGSPVSEAEPPFYLIGAEDYRGAIKWAYEKGMIGGDFAPKADCTRADAVNYIWQAFGKPAAEYNGRFADVPAGSPCAAAVAWAVANGVTAGTGGTTFSPDNICSRGQIVTFLFRSYAHT